jgi:ammonia channel protein AmtB
MLKVICVLAAFGVGGIVGVVMMCVFQINTINRYESKIKQLEKELEVYNG